MGWLLHRYLRKTKASAIADVTDHRRARITGRLRIQGTPLIAPLTHRECAYYAVARVRGTSKVEDSERSDFLMHDDGATALVRVAGARIEVVKDGHRAAVHENATERTRAYLQRHGLADLGEQGNAVLRQAVSEVWRLGAAGAAREYGVPVDTVRAYLRESMQANTLLEEGCLEQDEVVTVFGRGMWQPNPDPTAVVGVYRDRAMLLVIEARFITDDPAVTSA